MKIRGLCFNWKVLVGLAAVGLGVWVVAPDLVGLALPLLILLACPLSMLFMARGMQGGQSASQPEQASRPADVRLTRDEQLTELKAQLAIAQTRQQAIAREIAELEAARAPAVREAEAVARAAEERVQGQS
jgi:septal ring factor EnvC (AmiA/AmiB activator)